MDTGVIEASSTDGPWRLRQALVDDLRQHGTVRSAQVEAALRAVPRHLFVPGVSVQRAYANEVVSTKQDAAGVSISALSQPSVVAMMLEQAEVAPGHRVLEIGAGTGYNAALLAHLAGARGRVITLDLDEDIVAGARAGLAAAGCRDVRVVCGAGALGYPDGAPYDRMIATAGVWDAPPAWLEQLADGGRLVVPMRLRGSLTRSIVFERDGGQWVSRDSQMCGFMPLRGHADDARRTAPLTGDGSVTLLLHQEQPADTASLGGVLDQPRHEVWTGVQFGSQQSFEYLWLWLACALDGALSRMQVAQEAIDAGLIVLPAKVSVMATIARDSLAYLTLRQVQSADPPVRRCEVGVIGHGADAEHLTRKVVEQVQVWDRDCRSRQVRFALQAVTAAPAITGQFVFAMPHHRSGCLGGEKSTSHVGVPSFPSSASPCSVDIQRP